MAGGHLEKRGLKKKNNLEDLHITFKIAGTENADLHTKNAII